MPTPTPSNPQPVDLGKVVGDSALFQFGNDWESIVSSLKPCPEDIDAVVRESEVLISKEEAEKLIRSGAGTTSTAIQDGDLPITSGAVYDLIHNHRQIIHVEMTNSMVLQAEKNTSYIVTTRKQAHELTIVLPLASSASNLDYIDVHLIGIEDQDRNFVVPYVSGTVKTSTTETTPFFKQGSLDASANAAHFKCTLINGFWHVEISSCKLNKNDPRIIDTPVEPEPGPGPVEPDPGTEPIEPENPDEPIEPVDPLAPKYCTFIYAYNGLDTPSGDGSLIVTDEQVDVSKPKLLPPKTGDSALWPKLFNKHERIGWKDVSTGVSRMHNPGATELSAYIPANTYAEGSVNVFIPVWESEILQGEHKRFAFQRNADGGENVAQPLTTANQTLRVDFLEEAKRIVADKTARSIRSDIPCVEMRIMGHWSGSKSEYKDASDKMTVSVQGQTIEIGNYSTRDTTHSYACINKTVSNLSQNVVTSVGLVGETQTKIWLCDIRLTKDINYDVVAGIEPEPVWDPEPKYVEPEKPKYESWEHANGGESSETKTISNVSIYDGTTDSKNISYDTPSTASKTIYAFLGIDSRVASATVKVAYRVTNRNAKNGTSLEVTNAGDNNSTYVICDSGTKGTKQTSVSVKVRNNSKVRLRRYMDTSVCDVYALATSVTY